MPNRLCDASSPYLLQHRDNPVDWYPWGTEAFERARAEDKPVFLSIGYAACHWCHVMAHESFESHAIAAVMNEHFVNIKVDREERPDVDQVYMTAIQVLGQGGGWPLSAFCTPDGRPYYLGTYFPPEDRYGRPGFPRVLELMAKLYREERDKVEDNASAILEGLAKIDAHYRGADGGDLALLRDDALVEAGRWLVQRSDPHYGGFGTQPKFPSCATHDLLARAGRLSLGGPARDAFLRQARAMAEGGIYDHLGGGFARYSVDQRWLVPHFEKMLYDNGQLLAIYGDAHAMTAEPRFAEVIRETVAWLERELLAPCGGLYASQDADSEGEEGTFYVWAPGALVEALGERDAVEIARHYGVSEQGNFERGTTVLSRVTARGSEAEEAALAELRQRLFEARAARVAPATDTKILAGWNGLALSGLVRAWEATGHEPALALARRVADFLAEAMTHADGERLWRVYKDGTTTLDGTIDDYAFVAQGFFALAEATEDERWWRRGRALLDALIARFYEEQDGVGIFFVTPCDADEALIHRPESHHDGALPSGAGVAVGLLIRVARLTGDQRAREIAERYLSRRLQEVNPMSAAKLLAALDLYLNGTELVVTDGQGRDALLAAARAAYAPTLMVAGPWAADAITAGKAPAAGGRAAAYVCKGTSCSPPVDEPDALVARLTAG